MGACPCVRAKGWQELTWGDEESPGQFLVGRDVPDLLCYIHQATRNRWDASEIQDPKPQNSAQLLANGS